MRIVGFQLGLFIASYGFVRFMGVTIRNQPSVIKVDVSDWLKICFCIFILEIGTASVSKGMFQSNPVDINRNFEVSGFLVFLSVVLLAPLIEEYIFRKVLYNLLSETSTKIAIAFTTIFFASLHLPINYAVATLGSSFGLTYIYSKTSNLTLVVACHSLLNLVSFVFVANRPIAAVKSNDSLHDQIANVVLGIVITLLGFYLIKRRAAKINTYYERIENNI